MQRQASTLSADKAYYDQNYVNYLRQNPPAKLRFYLRLLQRWVPTDARIFELGVGLGLFLERAAPLYDCDGCDINAFGVSTTLQRVPSANLVQGSVEVIPTSRPPAAVVAWDVLEHLADLDGAISVIAERLQPGGFLIGVVPVYDGPLGWLVRHLDKDPTHVSKWDRRRWLVTLERHRFEVVEYGGILRRLLPWGGYLHWTRPQWFLRPVGSALYFAARLRPESTGVVDTFGEASH